MPDHPTFIDELFNDASRRRIIVSGRQCGSLLLLSRCTKERLSVLLKAVLLTRPAVRGAGKVVVLPYLAHGGERMALRCFTLLPQGI